MKTKYVQESKITLHKQHDVNLSFIVFEQLFAYSQKNFNKF